MRKAAPTSYEEEQARLKNEYDGKPSDIHVTAPQEPVVNPEVYKDVEPMLFRGFITVAAEINEVHFVFKSLNHHEFSLLQFSGTLHDREDAPNFWNSFLSYGVFMVDGSNILSDRERWLPKLSELFHAIPKEAKAKIIRHVSEVNRRASAAVTLTEAFAMETMSRYRWLQLKGLDLSATTVTGIEGTHKLGLNWAQQLWRALNLAEDRNEQYERDWENAKFIGSCFAGKGISKIYNQDTERRQKEKEERIARKDRLLRTVVLGEVVPEKTAMLPGVVVTAPRTVAELADQLEKDLRGDKDWHDRVIEEHERRIREQYQQRQRQREAAAKESSIRFGDNRVIGGSDLHGFTPLEVEERLRNSKIHQAQSAARMQIYPQDEKTENFLDKWGVTGPEISSEISTTKKDIREAISLPVRKGTTSTPFRKK